MLIFFKEFVKIVEEEILCFKILEKDCDIVKYCVLVFVVLLNICFSVDVLWENKMDREKLKLVLELCGMNVYIFFIRIVCVLEIFNGYFVKKIGDIY